MSKQTRKVMDVDDITSTQFLQLDDLLADWDFVSNVKHVTGVKLSKWLTSTNEAEQKIAVLSGEFRETFLDDARAQVILQGDTIIGFR